MTEPSVKSDRSPGAVPHLPQHRTTAHWYQRCHTLSSSPPHNSSLTKAGSVKESLWNDHHHSWQFETGPKGQKEKGQSKNKPRSKNTIRELHHSRLWQCHLAMGTVPSTAHQPLPSTATSWGTGNGSHTRTLQGPSSWQRQAGVPSTLGTAWCQQ